MICPFCKAENIIGAVFCGSCGKQLGVENNIPSNQTIQNQASGNTVQNTGFGVNQPLQQDSVNPPIQAQTSNQSMSQTVSTPIHTASQGSTFANQGQLNPETVYDPQMSQVQSIESENREPWYKSVGGLIVFFLIAGPLLGIILWYVWKKDDMNKAVKWSLTIVFFLIEMVIYTALKGK